MTFNLNSPSIDPSLLVRPPGGRLTFTTNAPVFTGDASAATTLYYTPYRGNVLFLWNGFRFVPRIFQELSLSLSGVVAATNYDVFVYDNAGVLTLEAVAWTNNTTRAESISRLNGLWKKDSDNRLFLGCFRAVGTGQSRKTRVQCFLQNAYNLEQTFLERLESTSTWNYNSTTIRQANASSSNQIELLVGVNELILDIDVHAGISTATTTIGRIGIGEDSTTAYHADCSVGAGTTNEFAQVLSTLKTYPSSIGFHTYSWLEQCSSATSLTFFGNSNPLKGGIRARWWF
ncbi:hypothetical protein K9N68_37305 (plasmid) [Kovacikia minuta CCNUW1]|uniref:hypothetical protein n=1 Tax=Kovacikia minuta TaxID=2931930 RepID=UPI001CC9BA54|nr:hypothetical protein [Kovacikia minuta]UBF29871.1 hypothetical protein K9N68_37305 [Kovacikia minuta CCNUW1]